MTGHTTRSYRAAEVLTASAERCHLLLLEAAVRDCRRAAELLGSDQKDAATERIAHAAEIVSALVDALRPERAPELVGRVAGVYRYLLESLSEAGILGDAARLADALRVLEFERDTWRQVCGGQGGAAAGTSADGPARGGEPPSGGIVLEA